MIFISSFDDNRLAEVAKICERVLPLFRGEKVQEPLQTSRYIFSFRRWRRTHLNEKPAGADTGSKRAFY